MNASAKFKRFLFANINKYQQQILIPALIICLLACLGSIYMVYYINYIDQNVVLHFQVSPSGMEKQVPWFMQVHSFNKVVPWLFFGLSVTLMSIVCWLFYVSNKLLGPTNRILNELDLIISGKRQDPIGTRPGDEIFEELVKRINVLIEKNRSR